ncbi:MAG: hypothetical protein HY598_00190 [Candidatus Omnitrophica bacterium]|nr:hypothetical protein [Candidatus Omnitrophota bacterium]
MDDPRIGEIQALVSPLLGEREMELVELICHPAGGELMVRLLVDRVGGVTIQQCAQANQVIRQALEASGLVPEGFTVEVSSPGLDRPLTTKRDFERAIGEDLRLDVRLEEGRSKEVRGMLLAVQPAAVVVKTTGGNITVPMAEIRVAKKAIRW